jgi:signal transduction histidine kinase
MSKSLPTHKTTRAARRRGLCTLDVAQIAHDFKGPLQTIALETFRVDFLVARPDVHSALDRIAHNVTYLDRLVQELLDVCELEGGVFRLQRAPTELSKLIERVIGRAVPTTERSRVRFDDVREVVVPLDELRIERVVANLIENALAYAPCGTDVVVRVEQRSGAVRVYVIDAGAGMDPVSASVVFEPHRRGVGVKSSGRGLGLYISKQIVEAHGGQIGVETTPGSGARFYFELPLISSGWTQLPSEKPH